MGWFLRRSIKLGPFRLNFSKSGLGASFGVRGARIGVGPRGKYIAGGRGGLYFRQSLEAPRSRPIAFATPSASHGISPACAAALASHDDVDLPDSLAASGDEVRRIATEKPKGWEYLLFAAAFEECIRRVDARPPVTAASESPDVAMALDDIGALAGAMASTTSELGAINSELQSAAGPPGRPGDPDALVHVAHALAHNYAALGAARQYALSMAAPDYFRRIREALANEAATLRSQLAAIPARVREGIAQAAASPGTPVNTTIKLIVDENELAAAMKEATEGARRELAVR